MKRPLYVIVASLMLISFILVSETPSWAKLRGASELLNQLAEIRNADKSETPDDDDPFSAALKKFINQSADLAPEVAAAEWLSVYDLANQKPGKARRASMYQSYREDSTPVMKWMAALPPPVSWPDISRLISERPEKSGTAGIKEEALALIAFVLEKDYDNVRRRITRISQLHGTLDSRSKYNLDHFITRLSQESGKISGAPDQVLGRFMETIQAQEDGPRDQVITVPDLVTLIGKDKAVPIIRRALLLPKSSLRVPLGDETLQLAQQLAIELIDELNTPQWSLVTTLDSVDLYEALSARFEQPNVEEVDDDESESEVQVSTEFENVITMNVDEDFDVSSYLPPNTHSRVVVSRNMEREKSSADFVYILGLIAADRTEDASREALAKGRIVAESKSISPGILRKLEKAGYLTSVYDFIRSMLEQEPHLYYWDELISMGAKAGRSEDTRDFVIRTLERPNLSDDFRRRLELAAFKAQLATDEIEDGVNRLKQLLLVQEEADPSEYERTHNMNSRKNLALQLATLGHLLSNPEWFDEGIQIAVEDSLANQEKYYYDNESLLKLLFTAGRYEDAEKFLSAQLAELAMSMPEEPGWGPILSYKGQKILTGLMELYIRAERPGDAMILLDQATDWGVDDLALCYAVIANEMPLGYSAAMALHHTGKDDDAIALLEAVLNVLGGYDPAYELYVQIRQSAAIPFLDDLFLRDQFEERPLIWKAHILRKSGNLDEAEAVAARAISIDPSDGEQGKGHRMRVYAEMGEIEKARGNDEKAEFFANVIKAIRLAENADDMYNAGLLNRGIAMYRESLNFFADAYCIQSRMAIQLEEMGDFAGAEMHYRKAYELMPDSFGRVESHCFGCEGVFNSPRAQGIAERVFEELYKQMPDKPQIPYLLGYLRESQGQMKGAAQLYREALALDNDYLNAWIKLGQLGHRIQLPAADSDLTLFNMIRLDPNHRHSYPRYDQVHDLASLWHAITAAEKFRPTTPTSLFPLKTADSQSKQQRAGLDDGYLSYWNSGSGDPVSPQKAIMQQSLISLCLSILSDSSGYY